VGKLASKAGDSYLTKICAKIAGDEARHEKAYQRFCTEILTRDPNGLIGVFSDVLKGTISMPAENMNDGVDADLYKHFSDTAQRLGVYTAIDYAEIIEHLVKQVRELRASEAVSISRAQRKSRAQRIRGVVGVSTDTILSYYHTSNNSTTKL